MQDRHGVAAVLFAVSATALLGMAALATEVGTWYLTLRNAQSGADAAAMAAASAYQHRGQAAAGAAATEVARLNGFSPNTVTFHNPPASGSTAGNSSGFEVLINKPVNVHLSRMFLGRDSVTVSARAVAVLQGRSKACLLSTTGPVTIQNSSSFNASGCAVGSNAPGIGVNIPQSNSSVVAQKIITLGTCSGCNNNRWNFSQGYEEHAPPLNNPYKALDSKPQPIISGAGCLNSTTLNAHGPIQPTGTLRAYCAPVTVSNTSAVTFPSGTYVFQNASLTIGSIASFTCNGCTFIFTGTNPGTLSISNTSTVNITAPASNNDDSDYDGIIFYRVAAGVTGSSGSPTLNLQSVSSFNLAGGIYFPQAYVKIGNVSSTSTTGCLAVVGGTIEIGSLSNYRFDISDCAAYRTPVPSVLTARLVE